MRKSLLVLPLLFAAVACGQKSSDTKSQDVSTHSEVASEVSRDMASADGRSDAVETAPDIETSVAPGVAFDFRYAFALASDRIGGVQEEHAQACKKLGISRCRVTGMDYQANGDGDVAAMLTFKLDPAVATDFTRDAKRIVEQADGKLENATLKGTDVGSNIAVTESNAEEIRVELASIEKQLAVPNLSKQVRTQLVEQSIGLRAQLRDLSQSKNADKAALAMTPVVFEYQTLHSFPGFDGQSPVAGAAAASANSFMAMLKFIMIAVGVIAPWALFGGAIFWLIRRLRKKPAVSDAS